MTLLLVRHAHAGDRHDWHGDDRLRPLTEKGQRQADALVAVLAPYAITRIYSSPFLRCSQTVTPLAAACGLEVDIDDALAEGHGPEGLRLAEGVGGVTVLCGHGDNVPEILKALGVVASKCSKGSTWVVERDPISATYLPPPD